MKYVVFLPFLIASIAACDDNINSAVIIGQWKQTEFLIDPGDGSGTYQSFEGNQIATFYSDSSATFTESFCLSQGGQDGKNAVFTINTVYWSDCELIYRYEIKDEYLFLYPPCIEPCGLKFEKISD
jgi:hypothetical protein